MEVEFLTEQWNELMNKWLSGSGRKAGGAGQTDWRCVARIEWPDGVTPRGALARLALDEVGEIAGGDRVWIAWRRCTRTV